MLDEKQEQDVVPHEPAAVDGTVIHVEAREVVSGPPIAMPAAHGLGQVFGLDPRTAILTVLVDLLLFGGDILSLGFLAIFSIFVAAALGWIVYRIQRFTYGDDHNAALTKAAIVALLTAIPVPLTPLIAVPGGIVGALSVLRRARK